MTTRASALRAERLSLTFSVAYGEPEVERVAERLGVSVSGAEAEAILIGLDAEIAELARAATRRAVARTIASAVRRVSRAHAADVDD